MFPGVLYADLVFTAIALAFGYSFTALDWPVWSILAIVVGWIAAIALRWKWYATPALVCLMVLASLGLWLFGIPSGWMLGGALSAVSAWSFTRLHMQRRYADPVDWSASKRRQLHWLGLLGAVGFLLSTLAMLFTARMSVAWSMAALIMIAKNFWQHVSSRAGA